MYMVQMVAGVEIETLISVVEISIDYLLLLLSSIPGGRKSELLEIQDRYDLPILISLSYGINIGYMTLTANTCFILCMYQRRRNN